MSEATSPRTRRWLRPQLVLWALAILALVWTLRAVPLAGVLAAFQRLRWQQILILILINALIVVLLSGRWWVILRAQGYRLPYLRTSGYRLSAFAVSYFTPGPHFGGEPLQVYLPKKHHGVPGTTATAAVALDKSLELLVNFTVLALGAIAILMLGLIPGLRTAQMAGLVLVLLAIPVIYLVLAWIGYQPLTSLLRHTPVPQRWLDLARSSEAQVTAFCRQRPRALLAALLFSIVTWALMLGEYWLMARFLGIPLTPVEALATLTAARFAYLLPFPGGLGALEASQVLAIGAVGYAPAAGAALALLIRARDVLVGLIGLLLIARWARR